MGAGHEMLRQGLASHSLEEFVLGSHSLTFSPAVIMRLAPAGINHP
jgi:hypothetical protein